MVRCATEDGVTFFDEHVVFSHGGTAWQGFANIVRRPDDGAIFLFSWAAGRLYVFRSDDGENFTLLTKEAYAGHDAMCVTWYPPFGQFLNYQTVTQPYPKRYPDNIGDLRRVLSFRRSADGVRWESFSPSFLGSDELWLPDSADPADLEFYRCVVFAHLGRYAMLISDYMPPPAEANSRRATTKHGPSYMAEWAISREGLNWKRSFRDTNAYMSQFWMALQGPLVRDGVLSVLSSGRQNRRIAFGSDLLCDPAARTVNFRRRHFRCRLTDCFSTLTRCIARWRDRMDRRTSWRSCAMGMRKWSRVMNGRSVF